MSRTIFVGDVHGCSRELAELFDILGPGGDDAVYFVGDLVARGPDSRGVLRIFRETRAKGVLGNHEARLLQVRRAHLTGDAVKPLGPLYDGVYGELGDSDWAVIDTLPLYQDVPEHSVRVVHAGVVPGVPFEQHDAWTLTHIRSVTEDGRASTSAGDESWAASYQGKPHLVFGHDARRGLQLHAWATGLDTGCVYGGSLTALVVRRGEELPFPQERRDLLVSVRAHDAYYGAGRSDRESA